jgi:5-methylcytosine-specific restriction endonuclease McrA
VRHWLRRHGLRTQNAQRLEVAQDAKDAGKLSAIMRCRRHGETEFGLEGRGYYRRKQCRMESVSRHRRKLKELLVMEAGGCCAVCGYDRYLGAPEFHHVDPAEKRMSISLNGVTLALDAVRAEAQKCVLLCSNCHAEVEGGVTSLPATVAA